jgi:hypothetical protein
MSAVRDGISLPDGCPETNPWTQCFALDLSYRAGSATRRQARGTHVHVQHVRRWSWGGGGGGGRGLGRGRSLGPHVPEPQGVRGGGNVDVEQTAYTCTVILWFAVYADVANSMIRIHSPPPQSLLCCCCSVSAVMHCFAFSRRHMSMPSDCAFAVGDTCNCRMGCLRGTAGLSSSPSIKL